MPDRIANVYVLCEDQEQQILVRRYLKRLGRTDARFSPTPGNGCGSQYVRKEFPKQVKVCRGTLGRKTACLLIVVTDADNLTVQRRVQTLQDELRQSGQNTVDLAEPIVIFTPKWQVETWIKCLLGQAMDEEDKNSDRPSVSTDQIATATNTLFDWSRPNANIGATCVPSLRSALSHWFKIG